MTKSYSEATNLWESCHSGVQHHLTSSTFVNSTQDSNLNCDWMFATLLSLQLLSCNGLLSGYTCFFLPSF